MLPRALWHLLRSGLLALLLALQAATPAPMQAQTQALKPVPVLQARVTDEVGMLTPDQRQRLERLLADQATRTGNQIAVLLVASTEPEPIEQYGIRVTDAWKLGRKGVDDGVLLLVARDNPKSLRRLRIEAGRGVQGVLTDAQSKRILQDTVAPPFRENDYYGGLAAGVQAIAAVLDRDKFPAPATPSPARAGQGSTDAGPGFMLSIFMLVVGIVLVRSMFHRRRPYIGTPGTHGWNNNLDAGTTGFILGSALGNARHEEERQRGGGFGGFSGGSSSDSGFSGGGGSFDGGGASGDW